MNTSQEANKELIDAIQTRIQTLRNYTPKIGVFGGSGVGKSSLCNALFGKEIAKISDVEACTRERQEILISGKDGKGGIVLIDVPGIGEDPTRQLEYTELYKSLVPELDLVLWAIKADDRNYASALDTYNNIFNGKISPPVVFVITQTDKTNDTDDWDRDENKPGDSQLNNIKIKEEDVLKRFTSTSKSTSPLDLVVGSSFDLNHLAKSKRKNIISIAIKKQKKEDDPSEKYLYNIKSLVELIVEVLPNEKKYSFTREAKEDVVSEQARKDSEKGIFDFVKQLAGEAWDTIKGPVVNAIIASAPKVIAKFSSWLKG